MLSSCAFAPPRNPPPGFFAEANTRHAASPPGAGRAATVVGGRVGTAVGSGTVVGHDRPAPAAARRKPRSRPASGGRLVPGDVAFAGDRDARRVPRPAGGGHGDLLPA